MEKDILTLLKTLSTKVLDLEHRHSLQALHAKTELKGHAHERKLNSIANFLGEKLKYVQVKDKNTGNTYMSKYYLTEEQMDLIRVKYDEYIRFLHHKEGFHMHVENEDIFTMTPLFVGIARNEKIQPWINYDAIVVDIGAGVGSDSISFFHKMYAKKIYAVESPHDKKKIERLRENVHNYAKFAGVDEKRVEVHGEGAEKFLEWYAEHMLPEKIDCVYVDPPWIKSDIYRYTKDKKWQKGALEGEASPGEIVDFIVQTTLEPMAKRNIRPRLIVIKLRYPWDSCMSLLEKFNSHIPDQSEQYRRIDDWGTTPFRNTIFFNFLIQNKAHTGVLYKDKIAEMIYDGKFDPDHPLHAENLHLKDKSYWEALQGRLKKKRLDKHKKDGKVVTESEESIFEEITDENGEVVDPYFLKQLIHNKNKGKHAKG